MKTVKVRLYQTENDAYVELWKVVGTKGKFYARYVCGKPVWYHVCDPLGYCELDYPCSDEMVFIICDQTGKPLFKDSNKKELSNPFRTLAEEAKLAWRDYGFAIRRGLNNWLLSYMTQENLAKDPTNTQFCPKENWVYCWSDILERVRVGEFQYLGSQYYIWKITRKHRYCDCEWYEYVAAEKDMDWEWPYYIEHYGEYFEPVMGPMYSEYEALQLVGAALAEYYGCKSLSIVKEDPWNQTPYERKMNTKEAAEYLISQNLSREYVDGIIKDITQAGGDVKFYTSSQDILKDYPECRLSSRLWY